MILPLLPILLALAPAEPMTLHLDATQAPRRLFHTSMTIPAQPGPLTLVYPDWIPGEHAAIGPVSDLAGLVITAGGSPLVWRRDGVRMHEIHCQVPAGADRVRVEFDYLSPLSEGTFTDGPASTAHLAVIDWHLMLLYPYPFDQAHPAPAGYTDSLAVAVSLDLPAGWKWGGALPPSQDQASTFSPVSLTQLVDHPLVIGANYRRIDLAPGAQPEHILDIVADAQPDLAVTDERIGHYRSLVAEAAALMGARRYERYHFLLSLSDRLSHFGLEHHECSDNRAAAKFLVDDDEHLPEAALLSHEYFHSWNGKFRRPRGLATPDYQSPMRADLLWVYEGLTEYYGDVLAVRCGNWSPQGYREYLAKTIANLDCTPGRAWRPLQDTCDGAPFLYGANGSYASWRRGTDFYDEGELLWLEADTIIREKSKGAKSLDDFCRVFHGAEFKAGALAGEAPRVEPYDIDDVCAALNAVTPHDWKAFFRSRLDALTAQTPKDGLAAAGWSLVYSAEPNAFVKHAGDFRYSIGLSLKDSGEAEDVLRGGAADKAGLGPGMTVLAVNGRKYAEPVLRAAIAAGGPIGLLVQNDDVVQTRTLEYSGGVRIPHLEAIKGRDDVLSRILTPRAG